MSKLRLCICGAKIPYSKVINGKRRNLKNRTKCLECLPFGVSPYSTSNLTEEERKEKYLARKRKNSKDFYERNGRKISERSSQRRQALTDLIGGCQSCGHNKPYNMAFHHVDSQKEFEIDKRRCQCSWDVVKPELLKCVMLCHNCHGDAHYGDLNCEQMHQKLVKTIEPLQDWPNCLVD